MRAFRRAFTLTELLLVIALISMLIALVVVSLKSLQQRASQLQSTNALKGMVLAYSSYSTDHRQRLMPGFLDEATLRRLAVERNPIIAKLKGKGGGALLRWQYENGVLQDTGIGGISGDACEGIELADGGSYVWRLAPYLDHNWKTVMADYRSKAFEDKFDREYYEYDAFGLGTRDWGATSPADIRYGIGAMPSFGMNSIFVGGDSYHGGAAIRARSPFVPGGPDNIAATRFTQVRNPSQLIVFGATRHYDWEVIRSNFDVQTQGSLPAVKYGYAEMRAPFLPDDNGNWAAAGQQWGVTGKNQRPEDRMNEVISNLVDPKGSGGGSLGDFTCGGGVPMGRWGDEKIPVGHLDGSTEVADLFDIAPPHPGSPTGALSPEAIQAIMSHWSPFEVNVIR